jgi:predicted nucleic acid-binding protein
MKYLFDSSAIFKAIKENKIDALTYQAMKKLNVSDVVSYDKHFDSLRNMMRQEPPQLV